MPTVKLTDAAVRRLTAPKNARIDYFDAAFPGLALRVTGGADLRPERRTWTLFYRFGGKQRRLTFEPGYPALGLADARVAATQAQLQIKAGVDPAEVKAAAEETAARAPDTFSHVVETFIRLDLERRKRAPRYIAETRRIFGNHVLPRWAGRDIKSITRRDVIELLDAVMDGGTVAKDADGKRKKLSGGPIIANRTLAAVRALFNWALRRGMIDATPAALVEAPGEETARARILTADEIRAVWAVAGGLGYPFGPFFQLALITGQRREEVAQLQWPHVDLHEMTWTLPAEATKAARTHVVPLAPLAIDILKALPRKTVTDGRGTKPSRYAFTTSGEAPISGFSKAKTRLDLAIAKARDGVALAPWTIHDARRTAATEMGRLGVSRFIIGKVLNHADRSVTGIYDRHAYLQEKRHALETWAAYLDSLSRPSGGNVMPLRQVTG
jgi:integrase